MYKEIRKIIASWIALIGGMLTFLYIVNVLLDIFDIIKIEYFLRSPILIISTPIAMISGIYGLFGTEKNAVQIRSVVGLILSNIFVLIVLLFWVGVGVKF